MSSRKKSLKKSSKKKGKKNHKVFTNIDLFWNGPNVVLMAKLKYLAFSHLTAMVPVQMSSLEGSSEPLKQLERDLIQLSLNIRGFCSHQYTLNSILHDMLDEAIESIRESKPDSLLQEIAQAKTFLRGGQGNNLSSFCKKLVLILYCQMSLSLSSESFSQNSVSAIYPLQRDDFVQDAVNNMDNELDNMNYIESKPVKMSKIIQKMDDKRNNILDYFQNLLSTNPDSMPNLVSAFNAKTGAFSEEYKNICKELMDETYDNHIFTHWKEGEELSELNAKIEEMAKTEDSEYMKRIAASVSASAVSFATADYVNAATYIGDVFFGKNTNTKLKTKKEKKLNDLDMNQLSKRFCTNSFQLSLDWEEETNTLKLVADKINYDVLLGFINKMQENIQLYKKMEHTNEENQLESIRQRFELMRSIVVKMQDVLHNDFHVSLTKINRSGSFAEANKYFSRQATDLHSFLELSRKHFPMDSLKLERNEKLFVEEQIEKKKKAFLEDLKRQGMAQDVADSFLSQWLAANTIMQSAAEVATEFIKMSGRNVKTFTKEIVTGALNVPSGTLESMIDQVESIVRHLLVQPAILTCVILIFLILLAFSLGNPVVWVGKNMLKIGFQGMTLVYKLIKTPFGYFIQLESTVLEDENRKRNKTKRFM